LAPTRIQAASERTNVQYAAHRDPAVGTPTELSWELGTLQARGERRRFKKVASSDVSDL